MADTRNDRLVGTTSDEALAALEQRSKKLLTRLIGGASAAPAAAASETLPVSEVVTFGYEWLPPGLTRAQSGHFLDHLGDAHVLVLRYAYAAEPYVEICAHYPAATGELPREWDGRLAISDAGEVMIACPSGEALVVRRHSITVVPRPFASKAERNAATVRAADLWSTYVSMAGEGA